MDPFSGIRVPSSKQTLLDLKKRVKHLGTAVAAKALVWWIQNVLGWNQEALDRIERVVDDSE